MAIMICLLLPLAVFLLSVFVCFLWEVYIEWSDARFWRKQLPLIEKEKEQRLAKANGVWENYKGSLK